MKTTINIALVLLLSSSAHSLAGDVNYPALQKHVEPYLSTKAPYPEPKQSQTLPLPDSCQLVHINYLGRHGSRHISKWQDFQEDVIEEAETLGLLEAADDSDNLTPLSIQLIKRIKALNKAYSRSPDLLGSLTLQGLNEQEALGSRLFDNTNLSASEAHKRIKERSIYVETTSVSRTQTSRDAFLQGLAQATNYDRSDLPTYFYTPDPNEVDRRLHFYDHCKNYLDEKKQRSGIAKQLTKTYLARPGNNEAIEAFGRHFLKSATAKQYNKLGKLIYALCRLDANMQYTLNVCPLILQTGKDGKQFMKVMHQTANIKQFVKRGPAGPAKNATPGDHPAENTLNRDMTVELLDDFLVSAQAAINDPNHPVANLRFAHDSTILRMLLIMGQVTFKTSYSRKAGVMYDVSRFAPMSANIAWQTYRCTSPDQPDTPVYKVRYLHNERQGHFPTPNCWSSSAKPDDDGLCPWSEVKSYYQDRISNLSLETVCGELVNSKDTDD